MASILSETKESLISEIRQREQERILEPENASLLVKLSALSERQFSAADG